MNLHQRQPRKIMSAREVAEAVFAKRAAPVAAPRILEDVSGQRPDADRRRLLGLPVAKNDNAPKAIDHAVAAIAMPVTALAAIPRDETPHEKVFRLVGERKFEEAARLAARLINADDDDGFFIYGQNPEYRRAESWFNDTVSNTKRSASATIHNVTPELAQVLLLNNDGNRRVKAGNLARIMRDISTNAWELNGESMVISRDGRVNDGQHRNFSVLLTGQAIKTVLSFGMSRDSMRTIDIGEKRQAKDRLGISGVSDAVKLAAVTAFAFQTYEGRAPTPSEADDYFHAERTLIEKAVTAAGSPLRGVGPSVGAVAAMHLLSIGADEEDIKTYFKGLRTGNNLSARSPIKKLHDGIFKAGAQEKLTREGWLRALVHHFVVWRRGRTLSSVVSNQPLPKEL